MDDRLFLLEILVERITFSSLVHSRPVQANLKIIAEVEKFLFLEIKPNAVEPTVTKPADKEGNVHLLNVGKSLLFANKPPDLLSRLTAPLSFKLFYETTLLGIAQMSWHQDVEDMIKVSNQTTDYLPPVQIKDKIIVKDLNKMIIGDISLIVRLTCFGNNIRTQYKFVEQNGQRKTLMKFRNSATVFQAKKYGGGGSFSELVPVGPLYGISQDGDDANKVSWLALYKSEVTTKDSYFRDAQNDAPITEIKKAEEDGSNITFDTVSILERPEEQKFLGVRPGSGGLIFEDTSARNLDDITKEEIEKLLCNNKNCPAVKKFAQYGIGPLAHTSGLGGIYDKVEPPTDYGLSQTYGTYSNYGPFGLYTSPKRPDQPFQRRDSDKCTCDEDPLRLTGGGAFDLENLKSPFVECQDMMHQVDNILENFKKAMGPCGKVTCPYSANLAEETCRLQCPGEDMSGTQIQMPYQMPAMPPSRDDNLAKWNACGSPNCAYTKYKVGLMDEDAMMELKFLPPVTEFKKCQKACPYIYDKDLPPIHWDCPDPLPKGPCKNPCCPLLPNDLKCLGGKIKTPLQQAPCYNPFCPLMAAIEQLQGDLCGSPDCPYVIAQQEMEQECGRPDCPYGKQQDNGCGSPDCPNRPQKSCNNPYCPSNQSNNQDCCSSQQDDKPSVGGGCANPTCPYRPEPEEQEGCDNPCCPFKQPPCPPPPCSPFPCPPMPCCPSPPTCPPSPCPPMPCFTPPCYPLPCVPSPPPCFLPPPCCQQQEPPPQECIDPRCPYFEPPEDQKTCSNPCCPYATKPPICPNFKVIDMCPYPKCPYGAVTNEFDDRNSMDSNQRRASTGNGAAKKTCCPSIQEDEASKSGVVDEPSTEQCSCCGQKGARKSPTMNGDRRPSNVNEGRCAGMSSGNDQRRGSTASEVCKRKYRPSLQEDLNMLGKGDNESPTEYTSDTRVDIDTRPCTKQTCKMKGGTLVCEECFTCPCQKRKLLEMEQQEQISGGEPMPSRPQQDQKVMPMPGGGGGGDEYERQGSVNKKYRLSIQDDELAVKNPTERTSDTRVNIDTAPCKKPTCIRFGGSLVCDDCTSCQCGKKTPMEQQTKLTKSETMSRRKTKRKRQTKSDSEVHKKEAKMKHRHRGKYVYTIGDKYPGYHIGHKQCCMPSFNVPPKMGWLWNIHTPCMRLRPRRGWRPGAVAKTVARMIKEYRAKQGLAVLRLPSRGHVGAYEEGEDPKVVPKPTLQIKKKDGCYWITMNPLKDPNTLVPNENPYIDCTPMQFKIVKNKKEKQTEGGETKACYCLDGEEEADATISESSSDSELDIEFTPPAGIIHPERFKKKRNVVHCDTQYNPADFVQKGDKKKGKKGKDKKGKGGKGKGGGGGKGKKDKKK